MIKRLFISLLLGISVWFPPLVQAQQPVVTIEAAQSAIEKNTPSVFNLMLNSSSQDVKEIEVYLAVRNVGFTSCEYQTPNENKEQFFIDRFRGRTVAEANGVRMQIVIRFPKTETEVALNEAGGVILAKITCDPRELGKVTAQLHPDQSSIMTRDSVSQIENGFSANVATLVVVENIETYQPQDLELPAEESIEIENLDEASESADQSQTESESFLNKLLSSARKVLLTLKS